MKSGLTLTIRCERMPAEIGAHPREDGRFEMQVASEEEIPGIVKRIVEMGGALYHVSARKPNLEEIYFALIERRKEERAAV